MTASALFLPDGARFLPTDLARGPWMPEALHGGPPGALLASRLERTAGGEGMHVARVTVELLRPVPVRPLTITTRLTRPGRKVQLVEGVLFDGEQEVARATLLRIRRADIALPAGLERAAPPPGPSQGTTPVQRASYRAFHSDGVEHRFVRGGLAEPGPATDWIRLRVPLVDGEDTSALARVVAVADFGNGVSWVVSPLEGYQFINPDLTVYLHRHPATEWVCLEAVTHAEPHGVGLAESRLWDESGHIGHALQSLLLDRH
jgi:hypothetical protein